MCFIYDKDFKAVYRILFSWEVVSVLFSSVAASIAIPGVLPSYDFKKF